MQHPGFNVHCRDNNKARWGYCVNCANQVCQNDDQDSDAAIGIGLSGQNTSPEMGAGWTEYFADGPGQCSAQSKTHKFVWLSIRGDNLENTICFYVYNLYLLNILGSQFLIF